MDFAAPFRSGETIGLGMTFKLPDNYRCSPGLTRGTFSEPQDSEMLSDRSSMSDNSPARKIASAIEGVDSDEDVSGDERLIGLTKKSKSKSEELPTTL